MINLRSHLASTTNNNLQGPNMPKYGFTVLVFLFSIKDMCLLDIICLLPILKMRYKKAGGTIRKGSNFGHIINTVAFICSLNSHNQYVKMLLFKEGRYVILSD